MKRSLGVLLSIFLSTVFLAPSASAVGDSEPGADCVVDWASARREVSGTFGGSITNARTGSQDCYDRLVIDVSGAAGGYAVEYVDQVRYEGSGAIVPLRGDGKLQILVRAVTLDGAGNPTYDPPDWDEIADVTGYDAFRQIAFTGTFEGDTVFGLGTRERLPFRVFTLDGPGTGSRLVVDVAHLPSGPGPSPNPVGNYESAVAVAGGVQVKGWTIDPDTTAPIYVWVTVDGVGRHLYANTTRTDVGNVYPAYGPNHGFRGTVPASSGTHTVCVTASNVGPGAHTNLGCRTVTAGLTGNPFGNYESAVAVAGGVQVKGWTIDPDTTAPIYVWVTVDGVGRHLYANTTRTDVGNVYPAYGPNHGFRGTVPASSGTHTVCVTASNVGPGAHTNLGCRTVTAGLTGNPFGNYESASPAVGGVQVKGWTIDPDTTAPIYVWVTVDGVGRHLYANTTRTDVGNVYPAYGPNHGFRGTVPASSGTHTVCVTASNVGPGAHTNLGCRTATAGLPASLAGVDWERLPATAKIVALTFDSGANDTGVPSILTTLAAEGVPATFFMTGDFARAYPARVSAIATAGHRLGNHSDTHAHYPTLTNAEIAADLARAEASIVAGSGGSSAKPLFRFPFGDRTAADIDAVNDAGYVPVRWTVDTLGWQGTSGGITADTVLQRVLDTVTPGQIVLMHVGAHPTDGSTLDADALPRIIDELRARGYSFVTLDALLS